MIGSPRVHPILLVLLGLALALGQVGCEKKLTQANYDKIQVGMSFDQVTAILGPGEKVTSGSASKLAQDYLGDIQVAQERQNRSQIKQGLGDLTGKINERDQQTQKEAGGPVGGPVNKKPQTTPFHGASNTPGPVRERWVWTEGKVEISVEFADMLVTSKNQDGL